MKNVVVRNIIRFLFLIIFQVLVLNGIEMGPYIAMFLYALAILMLPVGMNRLLMLVVAFASGLTVDIFSNVLGFHAFSATLIAFVRILFADKILTHGEEVSVDIPCFVTVGFQQFGFYSFLLFFFYNLSYFLLESFSFQDMGQVLLSALLSTAVDWVLILIYQTLFLNRKKNEMKL